MMNKQKTSKAGLWKVATFLPLLALLLMAFGREGENVPMELKSPQVQSSPIMGTWKLVSYNYQGGDELQAVPKASERIKFITETNFNWVHYVGNDKIVTSSAGGSYTFSGEDYIENIEFGGQGMAGYIGKEQKFRVKIENNQLELSGELSDGLKIKEVWVKYQPSDKTATIAPPPPPPILNIEKRKDGYYMDNKLSTLEELKKEAEVFRKSNPNGVVSIKDTEVPPARVNEINDEKLKSSSDQSDPVFFIVEEMPGFPGGDEALRNFISSTVKYPASAAEKGIQGKVYINFVVTKTGSIANAKVVRGVDPLVDQEALRVVNSLPTWNPGKQGGKNVDVSYTVPINFALEKEAQKEVTPPSDPIVQKKKLIIVPNPTQSVATITLEGSNSPNKLEVSIFSSYGTLISKESKTGPSFSLTVSNLTPGTYLVVATDGKTQYQGQMIVNH